MPPLWEALLLLDRYLFLRELRYPAALIPLFDPTLSPRSYALVAVKASVPQEQEAVSRAGEAGDQTRNIGGADRVLERWGSDVIGDI